MFLGHWLARTKVQAVNVVRTCLSVKPCIFMSIFCRMASILSEHILKKHVDAIIVYKIVPEPTMTNRAPLSLMNRLKKPIELSVSQSVYRKINVASRVLTRKNDPPQFHDDRKMNVTSRALTRKIAPPMWWPYIIQMNLLTEFHEDRTIKVASRVKNAPPLGGHVFKANVTIFEHIQDIIETNLLT
ncbi:hypothetical protein DPMN_178377 [Dreissena polymorpha]|uniref:Uncharacterized protein n=1 Tax=Dreissena polymorpha TaxID=45954 RepID=A0A9D4IMJ4_DREPO|nr:hypothetical protein DPMN_178377 [Dreissena polymorpha]